MRLESLDVRELRNPSLGIRQKLGGSRRHWEQEEKGTTKDEMAEWHHQLNGLEFGSTPGVGDGQGGLVCFNSWDCKESDTTERLN